MILHPRNGQTMYDKYRQEFWTRFHFLIDKKYLCVITPGNYNIEKLLFLDLEKRKLIIPKEIKFEEF